jgi:hypothetical protein
MADLSRTAANVKPMSAGPVSMGKSGGALSQADPAYFDTSGKLLRCQSDGTAAEANCRAMILTPATAADQDVVYMLAGGDIDVGATLAVGETYSVSRTAGAIAPIGDLLSSDYSTILGTATATNKLAFRPIVSGVEKP